MAAAGTTWSKGNFTPAKTTQVAQAPSIRDTSTPRQWEPKDPEQRNDNDDELKNTFKPRSGFSNQEEAALEAYQGDDYERINKTLWAGGSTKEIQALDAVMDRSRAPRDIEAYRFTNARHPMYDLVRTMEVGDSYKALGYDSTSIDPYLASNLNYPRDVRIVYRIPKGTKAVYMNARSTSEFTSEYEVLMHRNAKWRMISKEVNGQQLRAVMEYIGEG